MPERQRVQNRADPFETDRFSLLLFTRSNEVLFVTLFPGINSEGPSLVAEHLGSGNVSLRVARVHVKTATNNVSFEQVFVTQNENDFRPGQNPVLLLYAQLPLDAPEKEKRPVRFHRSIPKHHVAVHVA